jgi:hypothetical protein
MKSSQHQLRTHKDCDISPIAIQSVNIREVSKKLPKVSTDIGTNNFLFDHTTTFKTMRGDDTPTPPPIVSNGILLEKSLLTIVGQQKIGKSLLAFDLAIAIASGGNFLNGNVEQPRSVYIISPEGAYFPDRDRVKKLTKKISDEVLSNIGFNYRSNLKIDNPEHLRYLIEYLNYNNFGVLILDPLVRFHSGDENSANEMSNFYSQLHTIRQETGVAVVLIHHAGKGNSANYRGSSVIASEYDSCITLQKSNNGQVTAQFDMRYVETPDAIKMIRNPETLRFELANTVHRSVADKMRVLEFMDQPKSKKDLVQHLIDGGLSQSTAYRLIDAMIANTEISISEDKKLTRNEA